MADYKDFRLKLSSPFIGAFLLARVMLNQQKRKPARVHQLPFPEPAEPSRL
jgi:hypothetical protein